MANHKYDEFNRPWELGNLNPEERRNRQLRMQKASFHLTPEKTGRRFGVEQLLNSWTLNLDGQRIPIWLEEEQMNLIVEDVAAMRIPDFWYGRHGERGRHFRQIDEVVILNSREDLRNFFGPDYGDSRFFPGMEWLEEMVFDIYPSKYGRMVVPYSTANAYSKKELDRIPERFTTMRRGVKTFRHYLLVNCADPETRLFRLRQRQVARISLEDSKENLFLFPSGLLNEGFESLGDGRAIPFVTNEGPLKAVISNRTIENYGSLRAFRVLPNRRILIEDERFCYYYWDWKTFIKKSGLPERYAGISGSLSEYREAAAKEKEFHHLFSDLQNRYIKRIAGLENFSGYPIDPKRIQPAEEEGMVRVQVNHYKEDTILMEAAVLETGPDSRPWIRMSRKDIGSPCLKLIPVQGSLRPKYQYAFTGLSRNSKRKMASTEIPVSLLPFLLDSGQLPIQTIVRKADMRESSIDHRGGNGQEATPSWLGSIIPEDKWWLVTVYEGDRKVEVEIPGNMIQERPDKEQERVLAGDVYPGDPFTEAANDEVFCLVSGDCDIFPVYWHGIFQHYVMAYELNGLYKEYLNGWYDRDTDVSRPKRPDWLEGECADWNDLPRADIRGQFQFSDDFQKSEELNQTFYRMDKPDQSSELEDRSYAGRSSC